MPILEGNYKIIDPISFTVDRRNFPPAAGQPARLCLADPVGCKSTQGDLRQLDSPATRSSLRFHQMDFARGKRNIAAVSVHKLENDSFSAAGLIGRLAKIWPDLPGSDLTDTSVFKAITGGDTLMVEYKFKDSFEFAPYARN